MQVPEIRAYLNHDISLRKRTTCRFRNLKQSGSRCLFQARSDKHRQLCSASPWDEGMNGKFIQNPGSYHSLRSVGHFLGSTRKSIKVLHGASPSFVGRNVPDPHIQMQLYSGLI